MNVTYFFQILDIIFNRVEGGGDKNSEDSIASEPKPDFWISTNIILVTSMQSSLIPAVGLIRSLFLGARNLYKMVTQN